jgi:hypothetical protein
MNLLDQIRKGHPGLRSTKTREPKGPGGGPKGKGKGKSKAPKESSKPASSGADLFSDLVGALARRRIGIANPSASAQSRAPKEEDLDFEPEEVAKPAADLAFEQDWDSDSN